MPTAHHGPPASAHHITRFWVHYRLTDRMGVVYYGNYLELFEMARSTMIRDNGHRYSQMEADGYMLPVVHASVDYFSPAYYDDQLLIHTWVDRLAGRRIDFRYAITRNDDPKPICEGLTRHLVVGPDGKPRRLSAEWLERLAALGGGIG
jgi:acyl-CoA thioester hydrolase